MRLKHDVETVIHSGRRMSNATLSEGTKIEKTYRNGEPILLVRDGRWGGWYFVASARWIRENTV